jgi:hypothetical protein
MPDFRPAPLAPEGGRMATTIFLLLNAIGLVFLLYVLANFWKEDKRTKSDVRPDEIDFLRGNRQSVHVVTHLNAEDTISGRNVIPLENSGRGPAGEQDHRDRAGTIYEMRAKRSSAR